MKKILILYKFLPHYRIEFFNQLKKKLKVDHDINLELIYGKLKNENSKKNDERDLPWAEFRENKVIKIGNTELLWQSSLDKIKEVDLIIVEQANSLLVNYVLLFLSKFMKFKFSFWGHGANLQDNQNSVRNKFKYFFLNKVDYWFAYTENVKSFLISKKVDEAIISVLNNSIDTKSLKDSYDNIEDEYVSSLKKDLNIYSNNIAIYCGGIYKEKRIQFLLDTAKKVKVEISDFNLIILGAGPDDFMVKEASEQHNWIHYLGPKFGIEKVAYFKMSSLFLMPGLVGLAILDSFATQTPMITTEFPYHSPEIEYLENSKNGFITKNDLISYSDKLIELFNNPDQLDNLKKGCITSSNLYNTENMVNNFIEGVIKCLEK
jgi:L-malate glycosyltransferase